MCARWCADRAWVDVAPDDLLWQRWIRRWPIIFPSCAQPICTDALMRAAVWRQRAMPQSAKRSGLTEPHTGKNSRSRRRRVLSRPPSPSGSNKAPRKPSTCVGLQTKERRAIDSRYLCGAVTTPPLPRQKGDGGLPLPSAPRLAVTEGTPTTDRYQCIRQSPRRGDQLEKGRRQIYRPS